ncbi:MAG TPA: diaminopimelate decarboxylase [Roseiflexaceae bacterium]|nr:diaminopimelate decarboxylase [Roseiflexaceae bacterium]
MNTTKSLPFTTEQLERIVQIYPTPFYLYDERGIRARARALLDAFAWSPGFTNYFAVKATPNPRIMAVLADEGCGMDCSSLAELVLSEHIGVTGERIMFTSNNTPAAEFQAARRLGAVINLDGVGHLDYLDQHAGLPDLISFRYNPGPLREGNTIIGRPEEAKFGCTREQLFEGYAAARARGVRRFGLHTMLASNELDPAYFIATARMLFGLVVELHAALGICFEFVNLGGGIGIPYRPEQQPVDLAIVSAGIRAAYEEIIVANGIHPLRLCMECGRLLTGPHGVLVTRVRHIKQTYRRYAGVDASMADLMRPGMYGAYHHISVPGKEHEPHATSYDVVGSLCENNDKFAVERVLPELATGDVLVIHDAGAHGRAMGFNYNGKLRPAELLLRANGAVQQIRRAETLDDYFATLGIGEAG